LICTNSYEKINWFFDIIQEYTKYIKDKNYINLFEIACKTNNTQIAKYIYDLIKICGFEIKNEYIIIILDKIIYSSRWNTFDQQIIFELINLGVKPNINEPIYIDYYNNVKITKNTFS
jgi:hypothetical protein